MHKELHRHYLFLRNKEMNEVYLSVFLMNIAESMISIFVPVFLFYLHYGIAQIIFFFFLGNVGSVVFALPAAKIVAKVGAKHSMLISTVFIVLYYLGLRVLPEQAWLFYLLPFGISFRALFYNFGFDLNFIDHMENKMVGGRLSVLASLAIVAGILSPLIAGLIIGIAGYSMIFIIGAVLLVLSAFPLLVTKDITRKIDFTGKDIWKAAKSHSNSGMVLSYTGYAIESSIGRIVWPVFLIIILGTTEKIGYVATFAAFITVLALVATGKLTDKVDRGKLLNWGTVLYFLSWIGILFVNNSFTAFIINSYKGISERFLQVPWNSLFYKIIDHNTYFRLVVLRDMIFNASRVVILPFIMLIFSRNYYPFLITFILAALFTLLYPMVAEVPIKEKVL